MSSIEKMLKTLEIVRGINQSGLGFDNDSKSGHSSVITEEATLLSIRSPKYVASLASTITQQGQFLLSKKDHSSLTTRDKVSLCHLVSESVISGCKSSSNDPQKFISIGMETLMVLLDDNDPDTRMNADEAMNRIIRSLSDTHMGKIQLELFKEIKKNGSSKSLRSALSKFGYLCHHIRPQKCRAYVQNLLPHLSKIAKRSEENLQETLAQSFEKILPVLGYFTNDNEIRSLIKSFLPNVSNPSANTRRAACSCLILLCQHSRKPRFFFLWLLDSILQMLIPIQSEAPSSLVLGGLHILRLIVPNFSSLMPPPDGPSTVHAALDKGGTKKTHEIGLTFDQTIQVYEICLHYSEDKDHNIVTASLETLQTLLQDPCSHLIMALTLPEGLSRSRIKSKKLHMLSSRTPSQVSMCPSLQDDDNNLETLVEMCSQVEISDEQSSHSQIEASYESPSLSHVDLDERKPLTCQGSELEKNATKISSTIPLVDTEGEMMKSSVYSDIEIGTVADNTLLLGRKDVDFDEENSMLGRRKSTIQKGDTLTEEHLSESCEYFDEGTPVLGNIGTLFDKDLPVKYLVRYLCTSFLLSGRKGSLISDRSVRVSTKVLALSCIGQTISLWPSLHETLFIKESNNDSGEPDQRIYDILLYFHHHDPKMKSSFSVLVGHLIKSTLVSNNGYYLDYGISQLKLDAVIGLLCQLMNHNSSVVVRGAICGFNSCLAELLHSHSASAALPVIDNIMKAVSNSYWLVKVDICDLLLTLPIPCVDYLESSDGNVSVHFRKYSSVHLSSNLFSHRIIPSVFLPLLGDKDHRVRKAVTMVITKLAPHLLNEGDIILRSSPMFTIIDDSIKNSTSSSSLNSSIFASLHDESTLDQIDSFPCGELCGNEKSIARLVQILSSVLFSCNEKYLRLGCLEALCVLCRDFPPLVLPKSWGCHILSNNTSLESGMHFGLVTLLLALSGESSLAGDLVAQQYILRISADWISGRAAMILREKKTSLVSDDVFRPWSFLLSEKCSITAEKLVQHMLRILCVYQHVTEGIVPTMRNSLVSSSATSALSPIKKIGRQDSSSKTGSPSSSKGEKSDDDKGNKSRFKRNFVHLPEYVKLYDVLKSAYANYKMSLEDDTMIKFSGLLQETLTSLGTLLELSCVNEFGRLSEEILQYLLAAFSVLPTSSVLCGQKLLKCLFGANVAATLEQSFVTKYTKKDSASENNSDVSTGNQEVLRLNSVAFSYRSTELDKNLQNLAGEKTTLDSCYMEKISKKKNSMLLKWQTKGTDKISLSSYIRLFEPLVIKALKLYTISSDVLLQRTVLELLIHLVKIRVNYCLLDSEQIFIGYVIKQFEYIEEGQLKNADELIAPMFSFLVLLSYERHHSKNIISVPKIIQLCDGLMASGQPPLSYCVLALRPLVEDLFLDRIHSSGVDPNELETQKEVISSMLLRLAHYYQVLQLISIILISTHKSNKEKWIQLSTQVLDILLPKISKLQINIDSKASLVALEEVFSSISKSVFQSPDLFLKALLSSPCEIESTEGVERWIGGVYLLLKVLITKFRIDDILESLTHLGVTMNYVKHDAASPDTSNPSLHQSFSPKRFRVAPEGGSTSADPSVFVDPLNVTQPAVLPQMAIARFLIEVLRVGANELKTLDFTRLHSIESERSSSFLFHLSMEILVLLVHLHKEKQWTPVIVALKTIISQDREIVSEITESFLYCSRWHPTLALRWCQFLSETDCASSELWSAVLRTHQRKIGTPNLENSESWKKSSCCLPIEFLRRGSLLTFADFVLRHNQEGEWLTWLVVQHIGDVVVLHNEPQVRALLKGIYASSSASALLIQAFHARCDRVDKARYSQDVISIVSDVHPAQSGALLVFLIDRLIVSPLIVVSRSAASLCTRRLNYMLAKDFESSSFLPLNDIKNSIATMKKYSLNKRYGQVYCLLQQLLRQQQKSTDNHTTSDTSSGTLVHNTKLDLIWYLEIVKNRCSPGEGRGPECAQLLSHLEYNNVLMLMSSKHFNLKLLPHIFRRSIHMALQATINWGENCSIDTGDSDESSISEFSDPPLLAASKVVLLHHIRSLVDLGPASHHVFKPEGGDLYSKDLIKLFSGDKFLAEVADIVSPTITVYLSCNETLPWKTEIQKEVFVNILYVAVLNLEFLHFQCFRDEFDIGSASKTLNCVDAVLRHPEIINLLSMATNSNLVSSIVFALRAVVSFLLKPSDMPSLPSSLTIWFKNVKNGDSSEASLIIMELTLCIEMSLDQGLPSSIASTIRGIIIALGRTPLFNSVVRYPPELWSLGWNPEMTGCSVLSLPPIPSELLQESDVLKQFIFRISFFGFVGKQQFEETWMLLLSVLNSTPSLSTPPEELPYINQSLSLAIRGITSLLVHTLLSPYPGNPHNSSLFHSTRDRLPNYFTTKEGSRLQKVMQQLHIKLKEVQHLTRNGSKLPPKYRPGQLSVDFMASVVLSSPRLPYCNADSGAVFEIELRESQLKNCGVDLHSCIHFLHYHYAGWLSPSGNICASVVAEVVKSVSILSDLFTDLSHHKWVLETFVPLYANHSTDDHITTQYIIISTCKALATMKSANQDLSTTLTEGVLHIVEAGLRSIQVSVRTITLQGILYLLQAADPESSTVVNMASSYILKCKDGKETDVDENHEVVVWEVWMFLVEHFSSSVPPTLPSTALHMALTAAANPSTSPKVLHQVLRGVERLILVQESSFSTVEVVLKLAMDLVLNSTTAVSLAALPLFLTALHCSTRAQGNRLRTTSELTHPEDLASDPEVLLQFMEKLSVLFDRIRVSLPFEADVLSGLLGSCLLDILPASQLLNKVITEYISSHQPHPHLLAATLFQVFEAAMNEGGESLVQEWVLLSLSNFTQRNPVNLAVWCLTCFFIAASNNRWLRAVFPSVQMRVGKLEGSDVSVFCLAAFHFRSSLAGELQRTKFDDVFQSASTTGSPFERLLDFIEKSVTDEV